MAGNRSCPSWHCRASPAAEKSNTLASTKSCTPIRGWSSRSYPKRSRRMQKRVSSVAWKVDQPCACEVCRQVGVVGRELVVGHEVEAHAVVRRARAR
jgi:hypothetical protein